MDNLATDQNFSTQIINKIDLFDFIKIILTDKTTYQKLTAKAKGDHMFMTFRTLSIAYPTMMHAIGRKHSVAMLDALHEKLCRDKARPPSWLYTKAEPPPKFKGVLADYPRETLDLLMESKDWDFKTVNWLSDFDPIGLRSIMHEIHEALHPDMKKKASKATKARKKS